MLTAVSTRLFPVQRQNSPFGIPMLIIPLKLNKSRFTHSINLFFRKLKPKSATTYPKHEGARDDNVPRINLHYDV